MRRSTQATRTSSSSWRRRSASMRCSRSRERYAQLVGADRSGGGDAQFTRRVRLARLASEASQRERSLADRIIEAEARLGSLFSRHRGRIGGRDVNDNEIAEIMRESADRERAAPGLGRVEGDRPGAAPLVRELAHLRNEAARALGYRDHFVFSLTLDELDEDWLLGLLDELDGRLAATWERNKAAIDEEQRARLGLPGGEPLHPWDFADAFFRDLPTAKGDPLDAALGAPRSRRGRARLLPRARRRRRRRHRAQRPLPARRQEPARVLRRHRPPPRRARARQLRARGALARDDGAELATPSTTSRSIPSCRGSCAQPAHTFTTEAIAMPARPPRARRDVPRALRPHRPGDGRGVARRRDAAPRAARLRALGAGHDTLRAGVLPQYRPGSRRRLVVARGALPAHRAAPGGSRPDDWACKIHVALAPVYPELPAWRGHRLAARVCTGPRDRAPEPRRRAGRGKQSSCASASCARARRCAGTP